MTSRAPIAALAIAAVLGASGCGGTPQEDSAEDFQGAQRQVAQVVEDLEEAADQRDGTEICRDLLAQSLREDIQRASGEPCPEAVDDVLGDVDATALQVERVQISDDTATVTVRGESGDDERTDTLTLRREGRSWRITGLGS